MSRAVWGGRRSVAAGRLLCVAALALSFMFSAAKTSRAALTNPLAYHSLGSFSVGIGSTVSIDTTLGELRVNGILAFTAAIDQQGREANAAAGIPELAVFSFDAIDIGPGVAVTITGNRGLSLLSRGDVTLRSAINVNDGAAGGFAGGNHGQHGAGPGGGRASTIGQFAGGGGGGYGGFGGTGGGYGGGDSSGGGTYPFGGSSLFNAVYSGSGGGSGINGGTYGVGGGGGGALEISALGQVNLFSSIASNGGAGGVAAFNYGGGGGGSGGSIRVAGRKVVLGPMASISADGGAGGNATGGGGSNAGGGGGGGRVRIQQNAAPVGGRISAEAGWAIDGAMVGRPGTISQAYSSLTPGAIELNVRLGTGAVSGIASITRTPGAHGDLYGYIDHVGAGFNPVPLLTYWEGMAFAYTGWVSGADRMVLPVSYAANSRTTETISVKSNGGDFVLATGRGVGPTFATNMGVHPDTTINLGSTGISHTAAFQLIVNNASADLGVDSMLTSLGILGIEVSGPDAAAFSVDNLIPTLLYEGQHANLPIHFHPAEVRDYHATLTIRTDQGAANGAAGAMFTYQLTGGGVNVVPEPASLALIGWLVAATVVGRQGPLRRTREREAALRI